MILLLFKILWMNLIAVNTETELELSKYLEAQLRDYERIEYTIISPQDINEKQIELDKDRNFKLNGEFAYVPIKEFMENGNSKNSVLTLKLKLFQKVLVANHPIVKKKYINSEDFRIIVKEISALRNNPVATTIPFSSYRAKIQIHENTIVQWNMLEKIPQIESGDRVDAIFSKSFININFKVTARSSGDIGSVIKVKRDDRKIFKARVINNSTVKIIE